MKKIFKFLFLATLIVIGTSLSGLLSSCDKDKDKEEEPKPSLDIHPWVEYPQSYIRMFDYRMDFKMLNVQRNGTALQIDYTLANTGFGQDVTLTFYLPADAGHDNLGNTYKVGNSAGSSQVIASINGGTYFISGVGRQVNFLPNQTIKGSFTIKDFDINATAFSISVGINRVKPTDIILAADRMDFVNIPVPEMNIESPE